MSILVLDTNIVTGHTKRIGDLFPLPFQSSFA